MASHSSIVGGSTAERLINCPASYQATVTLPAAVQTSSEYAEEGTFAHAVMEHLMRLRKARPHLNTLEQLSREAWKCVDQLFHDRLMTREHYDQLIVPALAALHDLEAQYGGAFKVVAVEKSVKFPSVYGAFGTMDLILENEDYILHADWKFGAGVQVLADYDGKTNSQLMFYIISARNTVRNVYTDGRTLVAAIIQPRAAIPLSHTVVDMEEVREFKSALIKAVNEALASGPTRAKGDHCRFAPCKVNCPLWTGPLLDLSALQPVKPDSPKPKVTPYGDYLAKAKYLVDMLAQTKDEIDRQMHSYMESGGTIPGWRLKHKVKMRQWVEADLVEEELHKLGFKDDQIWQWKLQTFAATDATAKQLGVKIPDHLRVAPATNETTIATSDDPAPVVERAMAIEQFRASLKQLAGVTAAVTPTRDGKQDDKSKSKGRR